MKKVFLPLLILLTGLISPAQILTPARWSHDAPKKEVKAGETVELVFTATLDKNWYLYSTDFDPNLGPMVTTFAFKPHETYQLVGKIKPANPKKKYDDLWGGEYTYFTEKAEFRQTVKLLKANPKIEGNIEYQVCSEVDGKCIPGTEEFAFNGIKVAAVDASSSDANQIGEAKITEESNSKENTSAITQNSKGDSNPKVKADREEQKRASGPISSTEESILGFVLLAFLGGLTSLAMPCVYPLIPMTVSFFINQGGSRKKGILNASLYGLSIIIIYTLIGSIFSIIFGTDGPNSISSHWLPNLFFFVMLVVFGLSFLGLFEIVLPSWLVNRVDKESDKGGVYGIFFMAFTLALVSFSCTAPIAGSLLIVASQGVSFKSIVGMVAYSSAFAVPFTLFAIFPSWLKNLPKSGSWLNSVKVVLGFLELALALKFLSNADMVYHWGILDRDVFLALWIVIFAMIGFYLLGKITLDHDAKIESVSVPRTILALFSFAFVVYMVPGLFGAPLKPLAGILPAQTTQDFDLTQQGTNSFVVATDSQGLPRNRKYVDLFKTPHGLEAFYDLEEGVAFAKKVNKPILIDFTGHSCANCREMEARVWPDKRILEKLKSEYVLIQLYVDEKYELPESEWYTSRFDNRIKKTLGAQNFDYQVTKFNYNAQPLYVLLDANEKMLPVEPKAHDLHIDNFIAFLDQGLAAFKNGSATYVPMPVSAR